MLVLNYVYAYSVPVCFLLLAIFSALKLAGANKLPVGLELAASIILMIVFLLGVHELSLSLVKIEFGSDGLVEIWVHPVWKYAKPVCLTAGFLLFAVGYSWEALLVRKRTVAGESAEEEEAR